MRSASATIRAIFCDLDGTLLNPSHRISEYTATTLKRLKEKNVHFIVCTGRSYPDVFATIDECGLEPDFIITSNGARIHDGQRRLVKAHDIPPALVEELCGIWHTPGPNGEIRLVKDIPEVETRHDSGAQQQRKKMFISGMYQRDRWLTEELVPEARDALHEALVCVEMGDNFHRLTAKDLEGVHHFWFQITRTGSPADLRDITAYMKETYEKEGQQSLTLTSSGAIVLEVLPYGITKGKAVTEVSELLDVPLSQVACFGDAWNDLPMLEIAGYPFVMANALPGIHEALPLAEVIGTNAEDGVAVKLQALFW